MHAFDISMVQSSQSSSQTDTSESLGNLFYFRDQIFLFLIESNKNNICFDTPKTASPPNL